MSIQLAEHDAEIQACFPVMIQLRPHLDAAGFVARVRRQQSDGYHLAFAAHEDRVVACAGYRYIENLAWGRFLYVDDLVTDADARSQRHGDRLFTWLVDEARRHGCDALHLDSGVQRHGAHRFYLNHRMDITAHHFALPLPHL